MISIKESRKNFRLKLQKGQVGAAIGNSSISQTSIPELYCDDKNKLWYWDCPGFRDTKGWVQEIANGYYIENIIK